MTWPFCPQCGTILDPPVADNVHCDCCHYSCKFSEMNISEVITTAAVRTRPTWLGDEENEAIDSRKNKEKHALIEEPCPKCSHPEMYFYTMQLRSVDEGSTVFYECPKCQYKFSVNN